MPQKKNNRILIKLSGESLMGSGSYGISIDTVNSIAASLKKLLLKKTQICIVIGGGNIFRGLEASSQGMDRANADYMGMLATVLNGLALQNALEKIEVQTRVMSAFPIQSICETYIRRRAIRHLEKNRIVIFGAGLGKPYFTTDSTASLRAIEIEANVVLKGTRVDGIYSSDPEKDKNAKKFTEISFDDVYKNNLGIMDMTAFTLCKENKLPIIVFDMNKPKNLISIIEGKKIGTLVY